MDLQIKNQSLILITLISLLTSCGELSYKRGARPEDLERTKRDCQKQSSEASIQQCLKESGWVVQDLDTFDMFVTTNSSDNRDGGIKTAEELTPTQRAELAAPTVRAADRKTTSASSTSDSAPQTTQAPSAPVKASVNAYAESATPTASTETARTAPSANTASQTQTETNTPVATLAPDPMDLYKINSWWKIGAGMDANERDIKACAAGLGDGHQPDAKQQLYTRAMLLCMKEKGWRALKAAK